MTSRARTTELGFPESDTHSTGASAGSSGARASKRDEVEAAGVSTGGESGAYSERDDSDQDSAQSEVGPRLSVAAVARQLGVAPATLRTWDRRYGLGPSDHTSGRHRRYGAADLARLELMQSALLRGASPGEAARYALAVPITPEHLARAGRVRPAAEDTSGPLLLSGVIDSGVVEGAPADGATGGGGDGEFLRSGRSSGASLESADWESASTASGELADESTWDGESGQLATLDAELNTALNTGGRGLRLAGASPRARGLGRAALALDSWAMQQVLTASLAEHGVLVSFRALVTPVIRALRERHQRFGQGIEALRLLSDVSATALRSVIALAAEPQTSRPVMVAPMPGEAQELDLVALAARLAEQRVRHQLFGSGMPREALEAAMTRAAPVAVVLWAEQPHHASGEVIAELPWDRQRSWLLGAGPGWDAEAPQVGPSAAGRLEVVRTLEEAAERASHIAYSC